MSLCHIFMKINGSTNHLTSRQDCASVLDVCPFLRLCAHAHSSLSWYARWHLCQLFPETLCVRRWCGAQRLLSIKPSPQSLFKICFIGRMKLHCIVGKHFLFILNAFNVILCCILYLREYTNAIITQREENKCRETQKAIYELTDFEILLESPCVGEEWPLLRDQFDSVRLLLLRWPPKTS